MSVSSLRIPKYRREAIFKLANISDEALKELFTRLAAVPAMVFDPDIAQRVAADLKKTSSADGEVIVDMLLSLYPPLIQSHKSVNDFVEDLIAVLSIPVGDDSEFDEKTLARARSGLQMLLKVPSLALGAKASSVLFDNERSLISSRILTDIRPVFGLEDDAIAGALVIHTLKLEYVTDGESPTDFYMSMDSIDIDDLIYKLERAKRKAENLKKVLAAAAVPYIDSGAP